MPTIAPPEVIGKIDAAAAMQRMTRANVGEKPTPSAHSSSVLPKARVSQQPTRKPPAARVDRVRTALPPTRWQIPSRRRERASSGSRAIFGPRASTPMHPTQKSITTIRGARKIAPEVTKAATARGSIATASTRPREMMESAIASRPTVTPPSRRSVATLTT